MSQTTTPSYNANGFLGSNPNLNRLYDNVQAVVPAVQFPIVQMEAWNTIEDFFIQSTSERRTIYWQMAPGVSELDFNPYDSTWLVAWVLSFDGLPYGEIIMPGKLVDREPTLTSLRQGRALLALKPVSFSVNFSPVLLSNWFQVLLDGTLSRLYAQPAKPYSSPQMAIEYGRKYRAGVAKARAVADAQNTDGPGRWRFSYFANGRRKS